MGQVKAEGQLRHCFFGTYSAVVALVFKEAAAASEALAVLGAPWKQVDLTGKPGAGFGLVATLSTEELETFKGRFQPKARPCGRKDCRHGCPAVEIDNINHSIDFGPTFDVVFDVQPTEQTSLL